MSTPKKITLLATALVVAAGLAGCSSGGSTTPTETTTVTTSPQPTVTTTVTPSPSDAAGTGAGDTGTGSTTAPSGACATSVLTGAVVEGSGGAAGSTYVDLKLTNTGSASCTLQGWPGVSFVAGSAGTQVGAAAKFDRTTTHATVTVPAGGSTRAVLQIVQAGNYSSEDCSPVQAAGFRVYPPGQKASLFVAYPVPACNSASVSLLTVGAFQ
ncbi:DUF4232 domain-containing protein [Frondihabitans cladoniiphilus]|uniref:DUF4232 domain-containing protein n=1 Tax=Frondihabitans cladoniiphilus TaxID=715785 RepID=A0ABP8W0L7_9MICO